MVTELLDAAAARRAAPAVARVMAAELGRDEEWHRGEVARFEALVDRFYIANLPAISEASREPAPLLP